MTTEATTRKGTGIGAAMGSMVVAAVLGTFLAILVGWLMALTWESFEGFHTWLHGPR